MRFLTFFLLVTSFAFAQQGRISGKILFEDGQPVIAASVAVKGLNKFAIADEKGVFTISNLAYGTYTIEISSVEARDKSVAITIDRSVVEKTIKMNRIGERTLDEVVVKHVSAKKEIEEKGFAVSVIETKEAGLRNLQTNELLDRTVGVRIRQNGGLGADVNYNINGMSGNSVGIFIDGIPISMYGSSFDLNSIPPAMIDRIEVYKGVVPGHLSDDSLGGAINIVLKSGMRNYLNVSSSYGSFNTSQFNFSGMYRFDSGLTFKASGFYNYSDNDYEVWGSNVYNILPNGRQEFVRVKRFNDAFRSIGGVVDVGFTDVKWADKFFIGFTASDLYKEVQHGTFMTTPYKGRFTESDANLAHLTYSKKDIFTNGLELNVHAVYGERRRHINDTVKWNYNWYGEQSLNLDGNPIPRPGGAQQGAPTMANILRKVGSVRSDLNYTINDNHKILLNHVYSFVDREDDDEIRSVLERKFFGTRDLQKNISSLSYEFTALNSKLKTTWFGKHYQQSMERMNPIVETINGVPTRVEDIVTSDRSIFGYGLAISYAVFPQINFMTSAERGVRLPTENEVFGDAGDNIVENPNIKPETSNNFNIGFRLGKFSYKDNDVFVAVNGFYRKINDRIGTSIQTMINSNVQTLPFVNQGNVKSRGFDLEVNYTFKRNLNLILNTSKFDLTTKDVYGRIKDIPNEPTFTINSSAQYTIQNFARKDGKLNLYYSFLFVDNFNYMSVPYGNNAGIDKFNVPKQYVHDFGLSYVFPKRDFTLSVDAKNIFNKQAFDNFAVQKPGRAFYVKLNYSLNNF